MEQHDWTEDDARAYHRTHVRLTIAILVLHIAHLSAVVWAVLTLPPDGARAIQATTALISDVGVLAIAIGGITRFLLRRSARSGRVG